MATEMKVYRRSELETIKPAIDASGCLFRYDKIWNQGVDDTSDVALIGIAFHAINHAYIEKLREAGLGQDNELAQDAFQDGVVAAQTPSRLLAAVNEVWKWHAESFELDLNRFVAAEERGQAGDVGFTPDLVLAHPERNALEVKDFKSGWHPPQTEEELKKLFQARVYSRYAKDRWPNFSVYEFTLVAVRFRKSVTVQFTHEELDAVEQEVRAAIATIIEANRTQQWPATAGPACHFCSLTCPIADEALTLPVRLHPSQLPKIGSWLLVAEKQLRAVKKTLKQAVATHGPLTVNGMVWANRPSESRLYPVDALMDVLKLRGVMGAFEDAAAQDLTISHSALKRLFKAYPGLEDDLRSVAKTKTSYRFSAKGVDVDTADGDDE